ncbi:AAA family ATPase [Streptomyces sp. HB2AG]|uniref:AAA family ATPase n=1 Tax=Streptomyces sp. HB2AG TaxID=2983400 RepID=UPI0022AB16B8|nr:AAA family ATPase [Streptomyces sp. HB2AG]MCZ2527768.1 AAA family ATPase [Streptomyces sp. HB2AG]
MFSESSALVSAVEIRGLFGNKYLRVDFSGKGEDQLKGRRLSLLYGKNGSGKTTLLKLLWHALSPSDSLGHRSQISQTPFETFTIYLCSGDVINFVKAQDLVGDFTVTVVNGDRKLVEQYYKGLPDGRAVPTPAHLSEDEAPPQQSTLFESDVEVFSRRMYRSRREIRDYLRSQHKEEADKFVRYLSNLGTGPYMLADDRRIYGDDIEEKSKRRNRHADLDELGSHETMHGVPAELSIALRRVHEMIQRLVISGNVSGSRGSNNVYLGILEKISQTELSEADSTTREKLMEKLEGIANKTAEYSTYGLMPNIRRESFFEILQRTPDAKLGLAEDVLQPFLEAQEARLDALDGVVHLLGTLTKEVNRFFSNSGKSVRFKTQTGLTVLSEDGERLQPDALSSGERQVLLLLLNTVLARESTRLFLIDEPELSLNVKWQRQLMGALLALTERSPVQFIVATHSIEVITGHRDSLAKVVPRNLEEFE